MVRGSRYLVVAMLLMFLEARRATAIDVFWDDAGGSASKLWSDFSNWNPDGSVANDDVFVGVDPLGTNVAEAANDRTLYDAATIIASLTVGNGADVVNSTDDGDTNGFRIPVSFNTTVGGTGSSIILYGGVPDALDTNNLTINSGGSVILNSHTAQGTAVVEIDGDTGTGLLDINSGGTLIGTGRIDLEAAPGSPTTLIINDGAITANTPQTMIFSPPAAGTLQIAATSANAYFDWDGGGGGVLNASGNQTLDIDVPPGSAGIVDAFGGTMSLSTGSTIDVASIWSLNSGTINANTPEFGPVVIGQDPDPGAPARIAGGNWTMTGGTINVDSAWDSLQFDSPLTASGGTITNEGTLIFNANATFQAGTDFNMSGGSSSLVVNAVVNIDTPDFGLDGLGGMGSTTINAGGILDLDLGAGADLAFDHTINLNGGEIDITSSAATSWMLNAGGEINAAGGANSIINSAGETFNIDGDINVTANSTLTINSTSEFLSQAIVVIDAGSTLNMGTVTYSGGSHTGGGILRKGNATIASPTVWNVATVDLDDGPTTLNANLTINADSIDLSDDGMDDAITIADGTVLTVNISGGGSWTVDPGGSITYNGGPGSDTFLAGSNIVLNGTLNVNASSGQTDAVLNIGSTGVVNLNAGLRLFGGDAAANANTIAGVTINGPGTLSAGNTRALIGFGTINAPIDFGVGGTLKANDGTLTVSSPINQVGVIGTRDADGILNVVGGWNSSVAAFVDLIGGELTGGAITIDNPNGITGFGLVSARIINNQRIRAQAGTLVVETAANDNDWDGTLNTGELSAGSGNLEVRDTAAFIFRGTVSASAGRQVFANGFELDFEPASMLSLTGGTYRSTHATDIGGTVMIGAGTSTLQIDGTTLFENGSNTTLIGDLRFDNAATQINGGATFSGAGALINVAGRVLTLADGAVVDVLLQNEGTLLLGASPGQTQGRDFGQSASGTWEVELGGTGLNEYDRMSLTGLATVDGTLTLSLIDGYVPVLTDPVLTILTASSVGGTFDVVNQPPTMPPQLMFDVVYNAGNVQLVVAAALPGDFNRNGTVDAPDYVLWRNTLGAAVTAFSGADGDGDSMVDNDDYGVWRANFGNTAGSGSGTGQTAAVPEPASFASLLLAIVGGSLPRKRLARQLETAAPV